MHSDVVGSTVACSMKFLGSNPGFSFQASTLDSSNSPKPGG